ncbi:MAG: DUF4347 domain-containing protein, partial [Lentisphaeraceae bacterium]|nr:DUF4347 domain-containing protein [Lentisphaeraceae bacterium]
MNRVDKPIFEALEPRILLSGTPAPESVSEEAVHVDVENQSNVEVQDSITEILFVDAGVEGYESLIENFDRNVEVLVIPGDRDGVEFISSVLAARENLTGVHIFSHGDAGEITLGNTVLNESNVSQYQSDLQTWAKSLSSDADILIYGCNFGQSEGILKEISSLTAADIAASDNLTGDSELGGDADLEIKVGQVETKEAFSQEQFNQAKIVLQKPQVENHAVSTNEGVPVSSQVPPATDGDGDSIVSYQITQNLGAGEGSVTFNTTNGSFTFDPGNDFDDLNDGESRKVTFRYSATDSSGEESTAKKVDITVNGITNVANSQPTLAAIPAPTAVAEASDASAQNLTAITGNLTVQDANSGDTLTASIVGTSTVALDSGYSVPAA